MRRAETAILAMTDIHWGAATSSFDPDRLKARLALVAERLTEVRSEMSPSVDFDRLVLYLGGDTCDGSEIYATQAHHQRQTNVEQQARECAEALRDFVLTVRKAWGEVVVYAVNGNHGRVSKAAHEAASWDLVCYRYLRLELAPHGVVVDIDEKNPAIRVVKIRNHGFLLHHGHFISAGAQPIPAIFRRLVLWSCNEGVQNWDVAIMGHWHSVGYWRQNRLALVMSGTMKTDDPYPLEKMGLSSASQWTLVGVSERSPVEWMRLIELDDRKIRHMPTPRPVEVLSGRSALSGTGGQSARDYGPAKAPVPEAPHVHGRDKIVPAPSAAPVAASGATKACRRCSNDFAPVGIELVCRPCRTITCENEKCPLPGRQRVLEKWQARQRFCSLRCAKQGQSSAPTLL